MRDQNWGRHAGGRNGIPKISSAVPRPIIWILEGNFSSCLKPSKSFDPRTTNFASPFVMLAKLPTAKCIRTLQDQNLPRFPIVYLLFISDVQAGIESCRNLCDITHVKVVHAGMSASYLRNTAWRRRDLTPQHLDGAAVRKAIALSVDNIRHWELEMYSVLLGPVRGVQSRSWQRPWAKKQVVERSNNCFNSISGYLRGLSPIFILDSVPFESAPSLQFPFIPITGRPIREASTHRDSHIYGWKLTMLGLYFLQCLRLWTIAFWCYKAALTQPWSRGLVQGWPSTAGARRERRSKSQRRLSYKQKRLKVQKQRWESNPLEFSNGFWTLGSESNTSVHPWAFLSCNASRADWVHAVFFICLKKWYQSLLNQ